MSLSSVSQWLMLGFALAVIGLGLGYLAVRDQRRFLSLFMVLTALETTRDYAPTLVVTLSGMRLSPEDLVTVVAVGAAIARAGRSRLQKTSRWAGAAFPLLVGLGVLTWISRYDLQNGINPWRNAALAVALLGYATTRPRRWTWSDLRAVLVVPSAVAAVASAVGLLVHGVGSSSDMIEVQGAVEGGRPITASGALLMLVGLWVTAFSPRRSGARHLLIVLLVSMVLLTQHRSVWVAGVLSVVAWWMLPRVHFRRASGLNGVARTLVVLAGGFLVAVAGSSVASVGQSATDEGTWAWRLARWGDSMSISRSWIEWLVGSALGPTPASLPGRFLTSAHSEYVNAIETVGVVGLAAVLVLLLAAGRARIPPSAGPIGFVLCVAFLGFGVTYQLPPWAWMVTGVLLSGPAASIPTRHLPTRASAHIRTRPRSQAAHGSERATRAARIVVDRGGSVVETRLRQTRWWLPDDALRRTSAGATL